MKFKIQAGAEIDVLTRDELAEVVAGQFAGWRAELARGVRFRQFIGNAQPLAAGTWTLGGLADPANRIGPAEGMVWAVTRLAVTGSGFAPATHSFSLFQDEITSTKVIEHYVAVAGGTATMKWTVGALVLDGGSTLALSGTTAAAATPPPVFVSGGAVELPVQLAWQLIG